VVEITERPAEARQAQESRKNARDLSRTHDEQLNEPGDPQGRV
jgi:hypothetical protein